MVGINKGHTTEVPATFFSKTQTILHGGLAGLLLEQMILLKTEMAQERTGTMYGARFVHTVN